MTTDAPLHLVWLLLHDEEFTLDVAPLVDIEDYPQGALRALVMLAHDQVTRFRRATTEQVLEAALQDGWDPARYGSDPESVRRVYGELDDFAVDDEAYDRISDICIRWLKARHMGRSIEDAGKYLDSGKLDRARDALDQARKDYAPPEQPLTLSDVGQLFLPETNGAVPTGLRFVDHYWHGGVRPHELAVLVASTNAGKSMFLCYLARSAYLSNHSVVYYTSELTTKQILARIVSGILERPWEEISEAEALRVLPFMAQQKNITARLEIREVREGMTVSDLRLDVRDMRRGGFDPKIILLDSADDLLPERHIKEDWLSQANVYGSLRRYAVQEEIAIWSSTQANRDVIDKARISLKNMGRSFAKAQRAHFVVGLAQTEEQRNDPFGPIMGVYILKDSLWGSPGQWSELQTTFGKGTGFPGFREVDKS